MKNKLSAIAVMLAVFSISTSAADRDVSPTSATRIGQHLLSLGTTPYYYDYPGFLKGATALHNVDQVSNVHIDTCRMRISVLQKIRQIPSEVTSQSTMVYEFDLADITNVTSGSDNKFTDDKLSRSLDIPTVDIKFSYEAASAYNQQLGSSRKIVLDSIAIGVSSKGAAQKASILFAQAVKDCKSLLTR
jgi:hypothetical protein